PDETSLKVRLAQSLARAGRGDAALDVVRRLLIKQPEEAANMSLLKEVCELFQQPQRYDDELAQLAKTADSVKLRMQLADILLSRGRPDAAMEALTTVTRQEPG